MGGFGGVGGEGGSNGGEGGALGGRSGGGGGGEVGGGGDGGEKGGDAGGGEGGGGEGGGQAVQRSRLSASALTLSSEIESTSCDVPVAPTSRTVSFVNASVCVSLIRSNPSRSKPSRKPTAETLALRLATRSSALSPADSCELSRYGALTREQLLIC